MFTTELAKEDYAIYTFNSLLDLDNFWRDIMWYWADHLKLGELKEYVSYYHYGWWFLINLGRETKLFEHFAKKRIRSYLLCLRNLSLNRWGAKIYQDSGAKVKIIEKKKIDESIGFNVLGDTVIQVKYPPKIIKRLKRFYEKYKNVQEMSLKEITQLAHESCEIKFIMFKNPTIAENLRNTYRKRVLQA